MSKSNPLQLIAEKCFLRKTTEEIDGVKINLVGLEFRIVAYSNDHYMVVTDLPASSFLLAKKISEYDKSAIRNGLFEDVEIFFWLKRKQFSLLPPSPRI